MLGGHDWRWLVDGRWWWRLSLRGFIFFCPSVGWSDSVCLFVCLCGTFSPHCEHAQCFLFLWAVVVFLPFFSFFLGICSSLDFILTPVLVRAHSLESSCWLPLIVFSKLKCVCSVSRRVLEHTSLFWLSVCVHLSCLGGGERKLISLFAHTL